MSFAPSTLDPSRLFFFFLFPLKSKEYHTDIGYKDIISCDMVKIFKNYFIRSIRERWNNKLKYLSAMIDSECLCLKKNIGFCRFAKNGY